MVCGATARRRAGSEAGADGLWQASQAVRFMHGAACRLRSLPERLISAQQINEPSRIELVLLAVDLQCRNPGMNTWLPA